MRCIQANKVVVLLNGRYAGRKAVIVKNFDDGQTGRQYGHALVAGIATYPRKVRPTAAPHCRTHAHTPSHVGHVGTQLTGSSVERIPQVIKKHSEKKQAKRSKVKVSGFSSDLSRGGWGMHGERGECRTFAEQPLCHLPPSAGVHQAGELHPHDAHPLQPRW
jgi:hypothetical protein